MLPLPNQRFVVFSRLVVLLLPVTGVADSLVSSGGLGVELQQITEDAGRILVLFLLGINTGQIRQDLFGLGILLESGLIMFDCLFVVLGKVIGDTQTKYSGIRVRFRFQIRFIRRFRAPRVFQLQATPGQPQVSIGQLWIEIDRGFERSLGFLVLLGRLQGQTRVELCRGVIRLDGKEFDVVFSRFGEFLPV